MGEKKKNHF